MICYQDTTFCPFVPECGLGDWCELAYTNEIHQAACSWWGSQDPPVDFFVEKPACFLKKDKE